MSKALVPRDNGDMAKMALKGGIAVGIAVTAIWLIGFWSLLFASAVGVVGWTLGRKS